MTPRLASGVLVSALIRRIGAMGGTGMVLAKGDAQAGAVIAILAQRGEIADIYERGHDLDGRPEWRKSGDILLKDNDNLAEYLRRRRASDPDLWAIELDIADSERFAAEMTAMG